MTARTSQDNGPPTRISVRAMRADAVHRLLASPSGASVLVAADIYGLRDLASWPRLVLDVALDDLVADGRLSDDEHGHIRIEPLAKATA